jgi:AcrR family transcriptional regulator
MERAIPVFWKHGFAGTSVQDLEKATAVNKSGLYSEFKDKEDLFLASLKHYMNNTKAFEVLEQEPLGWGNIENFLTVGQVCTGQRGCFLVNSLRDLNDLPPSAKQLVADHIKKIKNVLAANARAAGSKIPPEALADMVMTFHSGLSNLPYFGVSAASAAERIQQFLKLIKG